MKKIIKFLIGINILLQVVIGIITISNDNIQNISEMEQRHCQAFYIPDNGVMNDPDDIFQVLKEISNEFEVNIIRKTVTEADGKFEIIKYVLFSSESSYYNQIKIKKGNMLGVKESQEENSEKFLSCVDTGSEKQVGLIKGYMYGVDFIIKPLSSVYDYFPTSGVYYVELPSDVTYDEFCEKLGEKIADKFEQFEIHINKDDFKYEETQVILPGKNTKIFQMINFMVALLLIMLVTYYLFRQSKIIGIMKLNGISKIRINFILEKEFYITYMAFLGTSTIILYALLQDYSYIYLIIKNCIIVFAIVIFFISIAGYIIVATCRVNLAVKGKKHSFFILIANCIVQCFCMLILLYIGPETLNKCKELILNKDMYKNWSISKEYGMFYPFYNGNEQTAQDEKKREIVINSDLYYILNQSGTLVIDAKQYEEGFLKINDYNEFASLRVNPNYLLKFPVYDCSGKKIEISENTQDWILLVPEKFKNKELDVIQYFQKRRTEFEEIDYEFYGVSAKKEVREQKIIIIWVANGQSLFSFNPEVYPENNNECIDSIIEVITEHNSYVSDRHWLLGGGNTDPLKIKLYGDERETYQKLSDKLAELGLNDNFKYLVSINEQISSKISSIYVDIMIQFIIASILFAVLTLITLQNNMIIYDKNKLEYIIKRMFGWKMISVYKIHLLETSGGLIVSGLIALILIGTKNILFIEGGIIVLFGIQAILSMLWIARKEKQKAIEILKNK